MKKKVSLHAYNQNFPRNCAHIKMIRRIVVVIYYCDKIVECVQKSAQQIQTKLLWMLMIYQREKLNRENFSYNRLWNKCN